MGIAVVGALVLLVVVLARKSPGPNASGQTLDPADVVPSLGAANALSPATAVAPTASRLFQNERAANGGFTTTKLPPRPPSMPGGGTFLSPEQTPETDRMLLTRSAPGQTRPGTLSTSRDVFKL